MDASNAEITAQLLLGAAQVGLFPLVIYFIYRGDARETQCTKRVDALSDQMHNVWFTLVGETKELMNDLKERIK